ncbi:MAG: hypothetical protein KatS3mg111_1144 [Pirellulaceae bacterium]|nr:MAG: hypothetical protein KatS3mg111_1144 [Pirellulaceae bacterium]
MPRPMPSRPAASKPIQLGEDRAVVLDLLWLARHQPMFPVERWVNVAELVAARRQAPTPIAWSVIFLRAYGLVCRRIPELRQSFGGWWRPCAYETDSVVISMAVARSWRGRERLFFARFLDVDRKSLEALQYDLDRYREGEIEKVFRQQIQFARLPWWWRRPLLWWRHRVAMSRRAYRFGTAGMSVLGREGVLNRQHPSPLTTSLNYGPIATDGSVWVTLQCDHRLIDGRLAATALNSIADCLHGEVLSELRTLGNAAARAA